jgi:hypothetical protein
MQILKCGNCGTLNVIDVCTECGRSYVLTKNRIEEGVRKFEDEPLNKFPDVKINLCDFCHAKQTSGNSLKTIDAGLRQRTCPKCHTEFLSAYGIEYENKDTSDINQNTELYRGPFGSCCEDLKRCMEQPNSLFFVEDNGTFFMSIGYIKTNDGIGWFDHAVFFCPFCGKQIQDKKEIADKAKKAKSE